LLLYFDDLFTFFSIRNIALNSMLVWSLGLRPFKDVFWTTTHQPGNPYDLDEANPHLMTLIAILSRFIYICLYIYLYIWSIYLFLFLSVASLVATNNFPPLLFQQQWPSWVWGCNRKIKHHTFAKFNSEIGAIVISCCSQLPHREVIWE